jgi:hypothetical protein
MAKRYLAALVVAAALGSMVGAKLQSSQDLFQKALSLEKAGGIWALENFLPKK